MLKANKWTWLGIAAAALALRLTLGGAQLPYHYQADEFQVIERALRVGAGELNPGLFTWPGTLVIYLNFLGLAAYFVVAKVAGLVRDAAAFADLYWQAPGTFYFIGRAISSAFGVAAVVMAGRWARDSLGAAAGFGAAAFVALAPAAVKASAAALPDMAAVALGTASLALAAKYVNEPKLRYFVAAGAFLGLGAAAKYHVLFYTPALAACALLAAAPGRGKIKPLVIAAATAAGTFLIACPFAILDARSFTADLASIIRRPGMPYFSPSPLYLLGTTLPAAVGWPLTAVAVVGAAILIRRPGRHGLVVALAATPFVLVALTRPLPPKHLLPLVPPLAVAAGAAVQTIIDSRRRALRVWAIWGLVVLCSAALALDVGHVIWAWREDTRTAAARYVAAAVPPGVKIITEAVPPDVDGPPLWPTKRALERLVKYYRVTGGGSPGRYTYQLRQPKYPFGHPTYEIYPVAELGDFGNAPTPAYAVLALADDRDFYAEQATPYGAPLAPWHEEYSEFLSARGVLIKEFSGSDRPGPTVKIYRLN
jgi:hypothetical protein